MKLELYKVTENYVKYLRRFEPNKILSNSDQKSSRKFLGTIIKNGNYTYVVPLSSPKYKKDFKIKDYDEDELPDDFSFISYANRIILLKDTNVPVVYMYEKANPDIIDFIGKLQCNNMIPVPQTELIKVDIDGMEDIAYKSLLQKQIQFLRKNRDNIIKKHINIVYANRKQGRMDIKYIRLATPDFNLLEQKCTEWEGGAR